MEQPRTSWHLDWLTGPQPGCVRFDRGWSNMSATPIPLPADWGSGTMELHHLGQGMDISRIQVTFEPSVLGQSLPLAVVRGTVPEPMFGVYAIREGRGSIRENRVGMDFPLEAKDCLFQHADYLDFEPVLKATPKFESMTITMGMPVLASLLGQDVAQRLLENLGLRTCPSAAARTLPPSLFRLLHETLPAALTDQMRILFSQAKTLEFLCALSTFLVDGRPAGSCRPGMPALMDKLRTDLMAHEGKVPMLGELAETHGLSARTLNEEFRRQFGTTIYNFILDHRLSEARVALEKTDVPMKVLADRLGYSHVNHFINAFKRRYGVSPGSLRRTT